MVDAAPNDHLLLKFSNKSTTLIEKTNKKTKKCRFVVETEQDSTSDLAGLCATKSAPWKLKISHRIEMTPEVIVTRLKSRVDHAMVSSEALSVVANLA